jgi:hypothetical protein
MASVYKMMDIGKFFVGAKRNQVVEEGGYIYTKSKRITNKKRVTNR